MSSSRTMGVCVAAVLVATGLVAGSGRAEGAIGPNGLIAYAAFEGLDRDIYTVDPANPAAAPVRLTTDGRSNENPDWSPDGTQIVYDSFLTTNQPTIHVMQADGTGITRISATPCCDRDFQPNWSPDGQKIAFVSTRDGDGEYELYVMDAVGEFAGPPAIRLTNDPAAQSGQGISDSQPSISPDSSKVVFLSNGRGAGPDSCDLFIVDLVDADGDGFGDNLTRITFDDSFNCSPFDDVNPAWSPDSSMIAFDSPRSGDFEVWVVDSNNLADIRNVTETAGYDGQPEWSPDGTQLLFVSSRSGANEVWSVEAPRPLAVAASAVTAAAIATQITTDGADESNPSWGTAEGGGTTCTITGTAGVDVLTGTAGADVICGLAGNDTISGLAGNDTLLGGDGNDTLTGGAGNDTINGEAGSDTAGYAAAPVAVTVNLTAGTATGNGTDTLTAMENILGSAFADTLAGTTGGNLFTAGAGGDTVNAGAGRDILNGQGGNDVLNGQGGNDTLNGQNGNDTLNGGTGTDTLAGGAGTDSCLNGETLTTCE